jgi:hypothetical protein
MAEPGLRGLNVALRLHVEPAHGLLAMRGSALLASLEKRARKRSKLMKSSRQWIVAIGGAAGGLLFAGLAVCAVSAPIKSAATVSKVKLEARKVVKAEPLATAVVPTIQVGNTARPPGPMSQSELKPYQVELARVDGHTLLPDPPYTISLWQTHDGAGFFVKNVDSQSGLGSDPLVVLRRVSPATAPWDYVNDAYVFAIHEVKPEYWYLLDFQVATFAGSTQAPTFKYLVCAYNETTYMFQPCYLQGSVTGGSNGHFMLGYYIAPVSKVGVFIEPNVPMAVSAVTINPHRRQSE